MLRKVYPRVCGGTGAGAHYQHIGPGLSPRSGGTRSQRAATAAYQGLSPRMRGNLLRTLVDKIHEGSIPAYAGEPGTGRCGCAEIWVYPRVCGGTPPPPWLTTTPEGLSPRMRGNPVAADCHVRITRSIPAYAGEPRSVPRNPTLGRVYPRVCGGTLMRSNSSRTRSGLSPRMRGNLLCLLPHPGRRRSIPAYAGEPMDRIELHHIFGVYPRVCGGTPDGMVVAVRLPGLSPRMRGSRHWLP